MVAGQVSAFINYINSASTFYRDSIYSRLNYISDQMNTAYGKSGLSYSVFLSSSTYGSTNAMKIYSVFGVYASLSAGVDRINPSTSYMFVLQDSFGRRDYLA